MPNLRENGYRIGDAHGCPPINSLDIYNNSLSIYPDVSFKMPFVKVLRGGEALVTVAG